MGESKIRVLHISKYYFPFIGGTEQIARDIVLSLNDVTLKQKYEQRVFCFDHADTEESRDYEDWVDNVLVYRCRCLGKVSSQSISLSYGKHLKMCMKEFKPNIIIFHYPNPFAAHYLLKYLKPEMKLIIYWHLDIVKQTFLRLFFKGQNRNLINRANRIVATSLNYMEHSTWLNHAKNKCIIIPNCIDEDKLIINEKEKKRASEIRNQFCEKIICLAVGRHVEYKGFQYLIEASKYLDDRFVINITGRGPLTEKLKRQAETDSKIHFLGLVSDEELKSQLLACDIFCFSSITKNEAFGLALAEGMYYGKPAVTFTIQGSGVNYVNKNRITGIECINRNSKDYARAMKELADNVQLRRRYGEAAKERIESNFTFVQFKNNIIKLVKDIEERDENYH